MDLCLDTLSAINASPNQWIQIVGMNGFKTLLQVQSGSSDAVPDWMREMDQKEQNLSLTCIHKDQIHDHAPIKIRVAKISCAGWAPTSAGLRVTEGKDLEIEVSKEWDQNLCEAMHGYCVCFVS